MRLDDARAATTAAAGSAWRSWPSWSPPTAARSAIGPSPLGGARLEVRLPRLPTRPTGRRSAWFSVRSGGHVHAARDATGTEKERDATTDQMDRLAGLAVAVAGGAAAAIASGDTDQELTGATRDKAVAAAKAATSAEMVMETETGDDGAAYGVEIP